MNRDNAIYALAQRQGSLYAAAARRSADIAVFSGIYLRSAFCKELICEENVRILQGEAEEEYFDRREQEKREVVAYLAKKAPLPQLEKGYIFPPKVAEWIGRTYAEIVLREGIDSEAIDRIISFDESCQLYKEIYYHGSREIIFNQMQYILSQPYIKERIAKYRQDK